MSDYSCSTDSDLSDGSASYQSDSQYILDLGQRCKGFRMGHINIQGLSNKIDKVHLLLESDKNEIHILGLCETKLNAFHPESSFEINGFQKPCRRDSELNSGGGLIVYVKEGIKTCRRTYLENENLECIWLGTKPKKSKPFFVGNIYRPPNSTIQWNELFEACIENALGEDKNLLP